MTKEHVGHHLMRVRIRKSIFEELQCVAEDESERTGEHVTVSDLVRVAIYNKLLLHTAIRKLQNIPPPVLEEAVVYTETPML